MPGLACPTASAPPRGPRWVLLALLLACRVLAGNLPVLQRVADGVYVYVGEHGEAGPGNLGAFANAGVVVGATSVAVVDTGGSLRFGERLLAAIRTLTDLPVSHVINTHVHPDHILGNAAFAAEGVRFVGHHKLPRAMAQRAPYYLDNFSRLIGAAFDGTRLVPPDLLVQGSLDIDLGQRRLTLTAHPTAHTDNDLTVLDHRSGTLFTGDLLFMERLPVVDGSLKGWVALIEGFQAAADPAAPVLRAVPGHGPASAPWPDALADEARYLGALLAGTRDAVARAVGIERAIESVAPGERGRWQLFDDNHPRNVTASYTELEWE